jgi:hypothetical protein
MVLMPSQWRLAAAGEKPGAHPFQFIAKGLLAQGAESVEVVEPSDRMIFATAPRVIFLWNGRRGNHAGTLAAARARNAAIIRLEHGFFSRDRYSQADHEGILHWASWAQVLGGEIEPPDGADERLASVWSDPLVDVKARRGGYVLVIGQVPGDTQLEDSEVTLPRDACNLVKTWLPKIAPGVKAVFRPHPKAPVGSTLAAHQLLPPTTAPTLKEAVAGARFVVTINSNSGNEALAWGCPVLAFGPAVYLAAGVARKATPRTFREDLKAMFDGWTPDAARVRAYLTTLAARQWNNDEFADGACLVKLLADAGVPVRQPEAVMV